MGGVICLHRVSKWWFEMMRCSFFVVRRIYFVNCCCSFLLYHIILLGPLFISFLVYHIALKRKKMQKRGVSFWSLRSKYSKRV
jgi:hypothetical protein